MTAILFLQNNLKSLDIGQISQKQCFQWFGRPCKVTRIILWTHHARSSHLLTRRAWHSLIVVLWWWERKIEREREREIERERVSRDTWSHTHTHALEVKQLTLGDHIHVHPYLLSKEPPPGDFNQCMGMRRKAKCQSERNEWLEWGATFRFGAKAVNLWMATIGHHLSLVRGKKISPLLTWTTIAILRWGLTVSFVLFDSSICQTVAWELCVHAMIVPKGVKWRRSACMHMCANICRYIGVRMRVHVCVRIAFSFSFCSYDSRCSQGWILAWYRRRTRMSIASLRCNLHVILEFILNWVPLGYTSSNGWRNDLAGWKQLNALFSFVSEFCFSGNR